MGQVERALGDFSNCFVLKTASKFLSYLQTHHQDYFLHEIRKAYELKPLYVLKLVRCFADDLEHDSEDDAGDFVQDIINYEMIAAFERNSFCSQEYLIDDFSFRRAIYDSLNEIFDELRPYGVNGKSIFSLKLSTGITTMEQAQSRSLARLSTILHGKEE